MIKYVLKEGRNLKTADPMFYAMAAPLTNFLKVEDLVGEIAWKTHLTEADIRACLSAFNHTFTKKIMSGHSVRLGLLGSFRPTIKSKAVSKATDFTVACIKGLHVAFTPSNTMKYQLSASNPNVKFERVKTGE